MSEHETEDPETSEQDTQDLDRDEILAEQEGKGYGQDEGEREEELSEE